MAIKKPITYLSQLKFDPKLNDSLIAKYLTNPRLVVILVLMILVGGLFSFLQIPKVLNPNIKIPIVIISSSLPGSTPTDVESGLTIPLENSVTGLTGLDTMDSTSQNSSSEITLQFVDGTDPDKALQDTQAAVNRASALPSDGTKPVVEKLDFTNTPVWSFTVSSSQDTASLMRFGKQLSQDLSNVSTIDNVTTTGLEDQEIAIILKPQALATYGLNPQTLGLAITAATSSYPSGSVRTQASSFGVTINPEIANISDLRNLYITVNGSNILLSDVATIEERSKPDEPLSYDATKTKAAQRSIHFDVYKTSSTTIQQAVTDAQKTVNTDTSQYGNVFSVHTLLNTSDLINAQFNELIRDLSITVFLVFIMLFIFLGLRQAVVASLAIPFTFMITFTVMHFTGIDLSFIAFFSLLLSLGLLVDDTVVVISAMTAYFRTGKFTPLQTGLLVWRDFIAPIFTSTITTVWAFVPLLLASGIIGDFIKPVPIVVSSTLLASFGVAMLITMPLIIMLLGGYFPRRVKILVKSLALFIIIGFGILILPKSPIFIAELIVFLLVLFVLFQIRVQIVKEFVSRTSKNTRQKVGTYLQNGIIHFNVFESRYRSLLDRILSSKQNRRITIIMVICFAIFAFLLLPLGYVENEFFPDSDQNTLYANLELPSGTNQNVTNAEMLKLLDQLRKSIPQATFVNASLGLSFNSSGTGFSGSGGNTALFTIVLPEPSQRNKSSIDIAQDLRNKYANYKKGTFSITEESGGPPAGADVQVKLFGPDLSTLDTYSDKIEDYLNTQSGITNVDKSVKSGTSELVFVPDQQKLADAGVTINQVGFWQRMYTNGYSPTSVRFDNTTANSEDITIRQNTQDQFADTLDSIIIPTQNGNVPLSSLGDVKLEPNPTQITRENQKRTISVTASVTKGYSVTKANANLAKYINTKLHLPSGYTWSTGGANEENNKSVQSILEAMILSFLLITITMVLQFSSFRKALIVMLVIPLSTAGVFIIFALTHTPLSFPALIGVLALFGIVVKNSILIMDKINQNLKAKIEFKDAIIDAAVSRLEPIALTSFTAIIGLIPITLSNALWQGLGGAIISGLVFSGTIMLFFIPVVYYMMFAPKKAQH